jgi:hypothetical protein
MQREEYVLMSLPYPLAQYRSAHSDVPPFLTLLRYFESVTGRELSFGEVAISSADFAGLRFETQRWAEIRHRLGIDTELSSITVTDLLGVQGYTAPYINAKLKAGDALVAGALS